MVEIFKTLVVTALAISSYNENRESIDKSAAGLQITSLIFSNK